jgi:predicted outer membrane protein
MLALFCMTKVACAVGTAKRVAKTLPVNQRSVSDQLLEIARARGVSVPARDAPRNDNGYSDAACIEREIKSHLEAIALYEHEASSSDAQLRAFAQGILPQLQRHLALLRSLKARN